MNKELLNPELDMEERTPENIAEEINHIKAQVRESALRGAIEIGRRLREAKSLIAYGQWGKWLQENVDYSERTAQNLMNIADEYGRRQSAALEDISVTQAILLLGLPAGEREAFAAENDMDAMSTRELKEQIDRLKKEAQERQGTIDQLLSQAAARPDTIEIPPPDYERIKAQLEESQRARNAAEDALRAARLDAEENRRRLREAETRAESAEDAAAASRESAGEIDKLKKKLADAENRAAALKKEAAAQEANHQAALAEAQKAEAGEGGREMEALREQVRQTMAQSAARAAYDGLRDAYDRLKTVLEEMEGKEAALARSFRAAFGKALHIMAEEVAGNDD